jgi:hypothetical protein
MAKLEDGKWFLIFCQFVAELKLLKNIHLVQHAGEHPVCLKCKFFRVFSCLYCWPGCPDVPCMRGGKTITAGFFFMVDVVKT